MTNKLNINTHNRCHLEGMLVPEVVRVGNAFGRPLAQVVGVRDQRGAPDTLRKYKVLMTEL